MAGTSARLVASRIFATRLPLAVGLAATAVIAGVIAGCGSAGKASSARPAAPNIVVVMTDDQDTASLSVMKNVQRELVDRGVSFSNNFVTTSECCPSRATFLTGQYSHNHGVLSNDPPYGFGALNGSNTLPVWLQAAGYETAYFGKYLNGYGDSVDPNGGREVPPGWGDWHGLVGQTAFQMYRYVLNENGNLNRYGRGPGNYQTDVLARKADRYVANAPGDRPFFMVVRSARPASGGTAGDPGEVHPRPPPGSARPRHVRGTTRPDAALVR